MKWIYLLCLVIVAVNQAVRSQPRPGENNRSFSKPPGLPPTVTKRGSRPKDAPPPRINKNNNSWRSIPPPPGSTNRNYNQYNNPNQNQYNQYGQQFQQPYPNQYWQQQQYGPQYGQPGYTQYNQQFNGIPILKPPPSDPGINADMYLTLDKHPPVLYRDNGNSGGRKIASSRPANGKQKHATPKPTSPPTVPTTYPTDWVTFTTTMVTDPISTTTVPTATKTRPTTTTRPTTRKPITTTRKLTTTAAKRIPKHFGFDNGKPNFPAIPRPPPIVGLPTNVDNGKTMINEYNQALGPSPWNQDAAPKGQQGFNNVVNSNNNKQQYQSAKTQLTPVNAVQIANKAHLDNNVVLKQSEKPSHAKSWLTGGSTFNSSSIAKRPISMGSIDYQQTLTSKVAGPAVGAVEQIADSMPHNDITFDYGGQVPESPNAVKQTFSSNNMDNGSKDKALAQNQAYGTGPGNKQNNARGRYGIAVLEGKKYSANSYAELKPSSVLLDQNTKYLSSGKAGTIGSGVYSTNTQSKGTLGGPSVLGAIELSREFQPLTISRENVPLSEGSSVNSRSFSTNIETQNKAPAFVRPNIKNSNTYSQSSYVPNDQQLSGQNSQYEALEGTLTDYTQKFEPVQRSQHTPKLSMMQGTKTFGQASNKQDAFSNFDRTHFQNSNNVPAGGISTRNGRKYSVDVSGQSSIDISYDRGYMNNAKGTTKDRYLPNNRRDPMINSKFVPNEGGLGTMDKSVNTGNQLTRDGLMDYLSLDNTEPFNRPTFKKNVDIYQSFDNGRVLETFPQKSYLKPTFAPLTTTSQSFSTRGPNSDVATYIENTNILKPDEISKNKRLPKLDRSAIQELKFRLALEKLIRKRLTNSLTPADQIKLQTLKQEYKVWKQQQAQEKTKATMSEVASPKPFPPGQKLQTDILNQVQQNAVNSKKTTKMFDANKWYITPTQQPGNVRIQQTEYNKLNTEGRQTSGNTDINTRDSLSKFERQQTGPVNKQYSFEQASDYHMRSEQQQKGTNHNVQSFSKQSQYDDMSKLQNMQDSSYPNINTITDTTFVDNGGNFEGQLSNQLPFPQLPDSSVSQQKRRQNKQSNKQSYIPPTAEQVMQLISKQKFNSNNKQQAHQTQNYMQPTQGPVLKQQTTVGYNLQNNIQQQQRQGSNYQQADKMTYKQQSTQQQNIPKSDGSNKQQQNPPNQNNSQNSNGPEYQQTQQQQQYNQPLMGTGYQESKHQQHFEKTNKPKPKVSAAELNKIKQQGIMQQFNQQAKLAARKQSRQNNNNHFENENGGQSFIRQKGNARNGVQTLNGQRDNVDNNEQTFDGHSGKTIDTQSFTGRMGNTNNDAPTFIGPMGNKNSDVKSYNGPMGNTNSDVKSYNEPMSKTNSDVQSYNGHMGNTNIGAQQLNGQKGNNNNGAQQLNGYTGSNNNGATPFNGPMGNTDSNGRSFKGQSSGNTNNGAHQFSGQVGNTNNGAPSFNGHMDDSNNGAQQSNGQGSNTNNGAQPFNGQIGNGDYVSQSFNGQKQNKVIDAKMSNDNWDWPGGSASNNDNVDNAANAFTGQSNNANSGAQSFNGQSDYVSNVGSSFNRQTSNTDNSAKSFAGQVGSVTTGSSGAEYAQKTMGPEKKKCSITPVCGTDGFTYMSDCFIWPGVAKACDGFCPCEKGTITTSQPLMIRSSKPQITKPTLPLQPTGQQRKMAYIEPTVPPAPSQPARQQPPVQNPPPRCNCPKLYRPVCGIKGTTYENDCVRRCNYDGFKCQGKCPCDANSADYLPDTIAARPDIKNKNITSPITLQPMSPNRPRNLQHTRKVDLEREVTEVISKQPSKSSNTGFSGSTNGKTNGQTMNEYSSSNRHSPNSNQARQSSSGQTPLNGNKMNTQDSNQRTYRMPTRILKGPRPIKLNLPNKTDPTENYNETAQQRSNIKSPSRATQYNANLASGRTRTMNSNKSEIKGKGTQIVSKNSLYGNNADNGNLQIGRPPPCYCSDVYAPVCGSDGVTYTNPCKLSCSIGVDTSCTGECPCETFTTKPTYYCEDFCGTNYEPVCSVTGRTFGNECLRQCSMESKECNGECPCSQGVKTRLTQSSVPLYSLVMNNVPVMSSSSGGSMDPQNFNTEPSNQPLSTCECGPGDIDPVCTTAGETLWYGCEALCLGMSIACSSECPC